MTIYNDATYLHNNPSWHVEDAEFKAAGVLEALQVSGLRPAGRIADVGCGAGKVASILGRELENAAEVVGFDTSPDAARFWPALSTDRVRFSCEDFLAQTDIFDVVLLLDVFEHIPDYLGFLSAIRPLGRNFVFNIPLDMNVVSMLTGQHTRARQKYGHLHYFSYETALLTLRHCGFQILREELRPGFRAAPAVRTELRQLLVDIPRLALYRAAPRICATWLGGLSLSVVAKAA